jgi:hypothetical protein
MTKQTLVVVLVAVVLFAVAIVGALAFTGGGSEEDNVHTMPGGETMTGMMRTTTSDMAPLGEAP